MASNSVIIKETRWRSITKGITWRFLATLTTIMLVYLFTKELKIACEVGLLEVFAKLLLYYFHERAWNSVDWGKVSAETSRRATD